MGTSSFFDYDKMLRRIPRPQTRKKLRLKISGIRSGFTQYWEGMYIWDMRVRVSFQKKTIRKEKLVTR